MSDNGYFDGTSKIEKQNGIRDFLETWIARDSGYDQGSYDTSLKQSGVNNKDITELHRLIMANGLYNRRDFDDINSFYLFPRNDPDRMLGTTREYIFITKPDLHIFGNESSQYTSNTGKDRRSTAYLNPQLNSIPFFRMLFEDGWKDTVLLQLQYSASDPSVHVSPFLTLLSNYKISNLDLSDISVGDDETGANIYNTKIFYRKASDSSDEDNEFSLEFKDNKYLDCYLWFKAYDLYEQQKKHGIVTPTNSYYIINKILSDQMTVFKFIVGDDGETIIYWAQLWGCYPKGVPRATFSDMPEDGQLKFSTSWKATFQQDLEPLSIMHFNTLCNKIRGTSNEPSENDFLSIYDVDIGRVTGESALCPYIVKTNKVYDRTKSSENRARWLLKWIHK